MPLPLAYYDAAVIEEIPTTLWSEAFNLTGWPSALEQKNNTFTYEDIINAFHSDEPNELTIQLLENLHTLGTEEGRQAILMAMQLRSVNLKLPEGTSAGELAMHLYLAQRTNSALEDVLVRAQVQMQEGGTQRPYNDFLAAKPDKFKELKKKCEQLREAILRHCEKSDLGSHVQVNAYIDDDAYKFSILRSDKFRKPLAVLPGQNARAALPHRVVHCDLLRYEPNLGRLRISVRSPSMVEFYRKTLGMVLFKDFDFFTNDPICSLAVLQEKGSAALDNHDICGVSKIRLTECTWECGDRSHIILRNANCFDLIKKLGLSLSEGTLLQAKLKVDILGKSARPVTVNIRVPSRITVTPRLQEPLMDKLLDAIGIRTVRPPAAREDIWSLYPWRHDLDTWRLIFGKDTDELVKQGVLEKIQHTTLEHPDYPGAGNVLRVEPVSNGEFHGVSDLAEIPSRALSATDIDALELNPESFRKNLRTALGISSGGVPWIFGSDYMELGFLAVEDEKLYIAYALREPSSSIADRIQQRARGAHIVTLMPDNRPYQGQGPVVLLSAPIPSKQQVLHDSADACGILANLPACYHAPENARLIVDTQRKKIWVYGTEVLIKPDSQPFAFIEKMAGSKGLAISLNEITQAISPARLDGNLTARQAKAKAQKAIDTALAKMGITNTDDFFPTQGTGFYRCVLPSFVK